MIDCPINSRLNPHFQLADIVVTEHNSLPIKAAKMIIEADGSTNLNPLLIMGLTGSGKTHLAQGLGNEILKREPNKTVVYATASEFIAQYLDAVKSNHLSDFYSFYQKMDVLILDDIHDFIDVNTQACLLQVTDYLLRNERLVVFTSGKYIYHLSSSFPERLINRCRRGLVVEINELTDSERFEIISRFAPEISEEVKCFISELPLQDIGMIKGIISSIKLQHSSETVSLALAKEVISLILGELYE